MWVGDSDCSMLMTISTRPRQGVSMCGTKTMDTGGWGDKNYIFFNYNVIINDIKTVSRIWILVGGVTTNYILLLMSRLENENWCI